MLSLTEVKRCPLCKVYVAQALDGCCADCGIDLDDLPETVDLDAATMTRCPWCGGLVFGKTPTCPPCGALLPTLEIVPEELPVVRPTQGDVLALGPAERALELARTLRAGKDWELKWERAEREGRRTRHTRGRARLYVLSLFAVVLAGGAFVITR